MADLASGFRLGPYEIICPIGAGGMGEVYRARDPRLAREVAVKVLPDKLASDSAALARFQREARAVAALSHPNIVTVHDFGQQDSTVYVVLEYLEGETLRQRLTSGTHWRPALEWIGTVASAIAIAHDKGIIHRDLKPENIFLPSSGLVKILDFGLATNFDLSTEGRTEPSLTKVGTILGTIGYMSPEQVRGQSATPSSDLFSLGCIVYEALTGQRAFQRTTAADTLSAILNEEPQFPDSRIFPPDLVRIAQRCLAKAPTDRYNSGRQLYAELRRALQEEPMPRSGDSLAVLPFANAGGEDAQYLSDGVTESLINNFTRIPNLRVVPRSVVYRYRQSDLDPRTLGRLLDARVLLTGKVVQRGDRLMVQAELVEAAEQKQIWGERFSRMTADLFDVEVEIARQITETLSLRLNPEASKAVRQTKDPVAYDLYLRARHHWGKRTPDSIRRAMEYLEAAITSDPNFAQGWAALAETQLLFGWFGTGVTRVMFGKSVESARTAIRLNPGIAEGHAALGFSLCCVGHWDEGMRECRAAIELNPAYFLAYDWLAILIVATGCFDEAIATVRKAKNLEPLSLVVHHHTSWVNVMANRFEDAAAAARQALELDPNYGFGWFWLGVSQTELGLLDEAVSSFERMHSIVGPFNLSTSALGYVTGRAGQRTKAEACLKRLEDTPAEQMDPYHLALVHNGLSRRQEALDCLSLARNLNSTWLRIWGPQDPRLDSLRGDPRFEAVLAKARHAQPVD